MLTGTFWFADGGVGGVGGVGGPGGEGGGWAIGGMDLVGLPQRVESGDGRLEEVSDGELEVAALFVRQRLQREAPLEAQRAQGREPADAEAGRGPQQAQAVGAE